MSYLARISAQRHQGRTMFVQVKAKFNLERDQFEFIEELAEPIQEAPRFLKASKKDKDEQGKNVAPTTTPKPTKREPGSKPKLTRPLKKRTK